MTHWLDRLEGTVSEEAMAAARQAASQGREPADVLQEKGLASPRQILEARSLHFQRPWVTLVRYHPQEEALALLPHDVARRFLILPLFRLEERLFAAMVDPLDLPAQDFVRRRTGCTVEPVLALKADLEQALTRHYLTQEKVSQEVGKIASRAAVADQVVRAEAMEDREAPAIRLVTDLLTRAVLLRASDIHLEPMRGRVQLRYRIDGQLHEFPAPPPALFPAVVARIKIASSLDIAERRLPQDGRTSVEVNGRRYDLRVSVIPNLHGEGVVIRVLNTGEAEKDLADLGFEADMLRRYERMVRRPYGMFLVTGPTGSGKTTTLYATLRRIFSPHKKMITLEDPVEFELDGVTQIAIRQDIGLGFSEALRSVLRHDPDIVMVGEIRDLVSAEIAVRAALTGHMLFATLHTNDAPLAVTRLVDMGLQPFQVLASLVGVLAQRLVRRLCPECRREGELTPEQAEQLGVPSPAPHRIFVPQGCQSCSGLGYRGRVALYELLEVTPAMRRLRPEELVPETLRSLAIGSGMVTLRQSAVMKLLEGLTSLDEVLGLTVEE